MRSSYLPRRLSLDEVRAEIDAGRPIILGYRGSFSGHVVVIHGYDELGRLWIHDPFYGVFSQVPYGQVLSYSGQLVRAESSFGIG